MKDCARPPLVVDRALAQWREALDRDRASYVGEWHAPWRADGLNSADAGQALAWIIARSLDVQAQGLNAMPLRLQLEFLDRLGAGVLPAQSARAPLVFKLLDSATGDATVPSGTRVAAVLPPPAPSLEAGAAAPRPVAPEFYTEGEITAMRGRLAACYSIDPAEDLYADHSAATETGFAVLEAMSPVPHRLYLGHPELLRLSGTAQVVLTVDFAPPGMAAASVEAQQRPLLLDWEYLSVNGWLPLTLVEDRTERFTRDGKIVIGKLTGPDAKEGLVAGRNAFWIRATVAGRVPSARVVAELVPAAPQEHDFEVETSRELVAHDVVTVDGIDHATVVRTSERTVTLDRIPAGLVPGEHLVLADALPPLRPDGADEAGVLPRLDVIRARVGFSRSDLVADKALLDGFNVDISKDFHPFGTQPAPYASFYVACKEAFSRKGARIELRFELVEAGAGSAVLAYEYFKGDRWAMLGPDDELQDTTAALMAASKSGVVSFNAPLAWAESELNGESAFWLRLRIASGDYGKPRELSVVPDPADSSKYIVTSVDPTLAPPVVRTLRVGYVVLSNPSTLEYCIAENDFALTDHSENARWSRSTFAPFAPVADRTPALHFGFTHHPPAALVSLLLQVTAAGAAAAAQPYTWEYWGRNGWTELSVRDSTLGLQQTGLVQFVGPPDALPREGLGGSLYRVRARLKTGLLARDHVTHFGGVWLNAVWASQGTRYVRESLGIASGEPDQTYVLPPVRAVAGPASLGSASAPPAARDAASFEQALDVPVHGVPVLAGEQVEVREWSGRGDDWETAVAGVPREDLRFETDPQQPSVVTAVWVRWHARPHLYDTGRDDRHYVVERARGMFRFPPAGARVPPAGAPIAVSYVTGGGTGGNVPAGTLRELRSGVGFIESVRNPLPAEGGAATESLRSARDRSVQLVRHRDRAVSFEDYEWLAREASPDVARVRALPLEGLDGRGARGFVGLVLVPHSVDPAPVPSRELVARVLDHLRRRAPAGVAGGIRSVMPSYVRVGVRAEILPVSAQEAGRVEARVRERLARYLHPLSGGADGRGWQFGEPVDLSGVAALVEHTPGVDAVHFLQLMVGSAVHGDFVPVSPQQLPAPGESQLKILVPSVPYVLG
ncbi:putative baseplate assembly protein [Schlegelella sp. S2-27]|uniref:Baseplate assembly protein n=1 Tax=Caldimonas mangrovi TaxID=2944811 RepID=A0ABT0YQT0_9BURK|nr:putative baseplate assembly protein [Caldimonas mangrovi]MCM5680491.1 putative baseplate assembly protein [Caldimonas mangrovi]